MSTCRQRHASTCQESSMSERSFRRLVLVLLAAVVSGCLSALGPENVSGTYVLVRVGGDTVPAVVFVDELFTVRVISQSIVLRADGTGTISGVEQVVRAHDVTAQADLVS